MRFYNYGYRAAVCEFFAGTLQLGFSTPLRLLSRALLLAPSHDLRNTLGLTLLLDGHPRSALCQFSVLARRVQRAGLAGLVLENTGLAYSILGRHALAADSYRALSQKGGYWRTTASSWMLNALQAGDTRSALEAAQFIDATPTDEQQQLGKAADAHRESRSAGRWSPTPNAREARHAVYSRLGPLSKGIADALD